MKKILAASLMVLNFLLPSKLKSQEYDSLKTVEVARNLENIGFFLNGSIIDRPYEIQIDYNDTSVVINCPLIAEKQDNPLLMNYPFFVDIKKKNSTTLFYKEFINDYGGLGFILDNNSISPEVYADSIADLLITSINARNNKNLGYILSEPYPNPAKDYININYETKIKEDISLILYDITGKKLSSFKKNLVPGRYNERFNISKPSGIYFLKATSFGRNKIKFIKKISKIK